MATACRMALVAALIASAAVSKNIFIGGDSMGEFSAKVLENFCKGATVHNAAVGGTTAVDWTGSGITQDALSSTKCGGKPDYIWLSVGGNDFLNSGCGDTATKESIAAKVTASINSIKEKAPGVKILMVGYCMPNSVERRRLFEIEKEQNESHSTHRRLGCTSPTQFSLLAEAIKMAAEADSMVTYVDSTEACGATRTTWSDKRYFADAIHLNNQGFCKVFSQPKVQEFFGCESTTYACESLTCAITGYSNCGEGGMSSCEGCASNCIVGPGTGGSGGDIVPPLPGNGGDDGEIVGPGTGGDTGDNGDVMERPDAWVWIVVLVLAGGIGFCLFSKKSRGEVGGREVSTELRGGLNA